MVTGTTGAVISLIYGFLSLNWSIWIWCGVGLLLTRAIGLPRKPPLLNLCWYYSKPFACVYMITYLPFEWLTDDLSGWDIMWAIFHVWLWRYYRNIGDDDDHKKLKKKMKEAVTVVNGRLVVVPRPA